MWAAQAARAVEALVLAAVGLAVPAHRAVLELAQVVAHRAHRVPLRLLARWPVLARALLPVPAARPVVVALAQVPVVAGLVVVPAARLLNRQWFSAAMARTTR
jgi:hypothetical protein